MKSPLLPIFLIVLVDVMGLTIVLPYLPFFAQSLGATPLVVGVLQASFAACQLCAAPVLGQFSDRLGRKRVLIFSQFGTLVGFLMMAASANLFWLFSSRILQGLTTGNIAIAQACIADVTVPEKRAKSFAIIGIAFGIGFLMGPALSGFLSSYGYAAPVLFAAGLSIISITCTYFLLPAQVSQGGRKSDSPGRLSILEWRAYLDYFKRPGLRILLSQFSLFTFSFATFVSGFSLFAQRRYLWHGQPFGPKQVGYVFAFGGFLAIFSQGWLIGKLVGWFGERRLLQWAFVTAGAAVAVLGVSYSIPALLISSGAFLIGQGALRPSLISLITRISHSDERGAILGLTQSLTAATQVLAPLLGGLLIDRMLLIPWALVPAVCLGGGWLLSLGFTGPLDTPESSGAAVSGAQMLN